MKELHQGRHVQTLMLILVPKNPFHLVDLYQQLKVFQSPHFSLVLIQYRQHIDRADFSNKNKLDQKDYTLDLECELVLR